MKIKILRDTSASGKHLSKDEVYDAPGDISEKDAGILINLRSAALVPPKGMEDKVEGAAEAQGSGEGAGSPAEKKDQVSDSSEKKSDLSKKRNGKK